MPAKGKGEDCPVEGSETHTVRLLASCLYLLNTRHFLQLNSLSTCVSMEE